MSTDFVPLAKVSDTRGVELLAEIVAEIEAAGFQTWRQDSWIDRVDDNGELVESLLYLDQLAPAVRERMVPAFDCGTVACLFGHAVFKGGATFARDEEFDSDAVSNSCVMKPGAERPVSVFGFAQELLELPDDFARWLSSPHRDWSEITAFLRAWQADTQVGHPDFDAHREALVFGRGTE